MRRKRFKIRLGLIVAIAVVALSVAASAQAKRGYAGSSVSVRSLTNANTIQSYGPRDGWYPYAVSLTNASHNATIVDGRSPDTRDAALVAQPVRTLQGSSSQFGPPDGWYPYAVSLTRSTHNVTIVDGRSPDTRDASVVAQQQALVPVDGRSPDTIDSAQAAQAVLVTPADGRSPDTIDSAVQVHSPVVTVTRSPGFNWGDFGIGVAAALGIMLLLGISTGTLRGRQGRKQTGSVATA